MFGYRRNKEVGGWTRECVMRNYFAPFTKYWEYMIKMARQKKNKAHVGEVRNVKHSFSLDTSKERD